MGRQTLMHDFALPGRAITVGLALQERLIEALVLFLRQRRRHAIGGIEPRQRRGAVHA